MKAKLLRLLSVIGLILAALASLDLTGITAVLPPEYAGKALAAGLLIAALRDAVLMFGDLADDGKRNNSWRPAFSPPATIAGVMWAVMQSRLAAQDKIIEAQTTTISKLQDDVERLAKGCGHPECLWRGR